jgi:putative transposase
MRIKELAMSRIRFGYQRILVLPQREGWSVGKKLVCRLYREQGLQVKTKRRKKLASQNRGKLDPAKVSNERWSMDFVTDRLEDGRYFRALTLIDQYDRSSLGVVPALSFSGAKLSHCLDGMAQQRSYPQSITCDNGPEFCSRALTPGPIGITYGLIISGPVSR